jgi:hypothetical protein
VNDAVFRVRIPGDGNPHTIKVDTEGSAIDTVISLHSAPPIVPQTIPVYNTEANTTAAFNMGVAQNAVTVLEGDTTGASAKFAGESRGDWRRIRMRGLTGWVKDGRFAPPRRTTGKRRAAR